MPTKTVSYTHLIPENKPILEKDLEKKLIRHIEDFLLELGKGFMFVGSQQRITINNTHNYVDMVFYNKILKSYILIELKTRKLKASDVGQLNAYLNLSLIHISFYPGLSSEHSKVD